MNSAQYRQFAHECIQWANDARSEPVRQQFLELATLWMAAAARIDAKADSVSPSKASNGDGRDPPAVTLEPQ